MIDRLSRCFKQVLIAQLIILVLGALCSAVFLNMGFALAIAYGASLALLNTVLSKRSIQRAGELAYQQPDLSMMPVFTGLVQRIVLFAAGFASGVVLLGLLPIPVLIGFGLAQTGYLACKAV